MTEGAAGSCVAGGRDIIRRAVLSSAGSAGQLITQKYNEFHEFHCIKNGLVYNIVLCQGKTKFSEPNPEEFAEFLAEKTESCYNGAR